GKLIGAAGPADEVLDIAGLASDIDLAAPIKNPPFTLGFGQKTLELRCFRSRNSQILRVGKHCKMKMLGNAEPDQAAIHGGDTRKSRKRVFVVDRDEDRGAGLQRTGLRGSFSARRKYTQDCGHPAPDQPEAADGDE